MSLCRIALRIAAVEALRGRTLVGDNVLDSPNGALDIQADGSLRTGEDTPFVSVYTDDGVAEDIEGRSLYANGICVLVIEAGISMAMTELDRQTGASRLIGINVPVSDATFEFHLDIVQRQVMDALTDPDNAWAEIYRSLHLRVLKVETAGKRNTDDGQRLAGHQTRITLHLLNDPVFGEGLDDDLPFTQFLTKLSASSSASHVEQARVMRTLIGGADPDWKVHQRRRGLTADELRAVGLGPVEQDALRATPEMSASTLDVEGVGSVSIAS